jgi:hypothetical protein
MTIVCGEALIFAHRENHPGVADFKVLEGAKVPGVPDRWPFHPAVRVAKLVDTHFDNAVFADGVLPGRGRIRPSIGWRPE